MKRSLTLSAVLFSFSLPVAAAETADDYLRAAHSAEACADVRLGLMEELRLNDLIKLNTGDTTTVLDTAERLNTLRRTEPVVCDTPETAQAMGFFSERVEPYLSAPVFRTDRRV